MYHTNVKSEIQDFQLNAEIMDKWSIFKIDSIDYVIKFDQQEEGDTLQSIACWLSDFTSLWSETIVTHDALVRFKKCNPLLECNEMKTQILSTICSMPKNGNNLHLIGQTTDNVHLSAKYYLSDGSDDIPLKFTWTLDKSCSQSFHENFTNILLQKMFELEKTNEYLIEIIRKKDQEILKHTIANETNNNKIDVMKDTVKDSQQTSGMSISGDVMKYDKVMDEVADVQLNQVAEVADCTISNDESANTEVSTETIHPGFTCDNCGMDICGHRYNCIECDDFDLCTKCELNNNHTHHIMARFAHPQVKLTLNLC